MLHADASARHVYANLPLEMMHAPVLGPAHPFQRDGIAAGMKNHRSGHVEVRRGFGPWRCECVTGNAPCAARGAEECVGRGLPEQRLSTAQGDESEGSIAWQPQAGSRERCMGMRLGLEGRRHVSPAQIAALC